MNIFQKIWKEITRDRIDEIFQRGYKLGRQHEKESWEFDIRFHLPQVINKVEKKFKIKIICH